MALFGNRAATSFSRFAGTALLLFIFFLPLHSHFSLTPQLSGQCVCLQGGRLQLDLPDNAAILEPTLRSTPLFEPQISARPCLERRCQPVRGPPLVLSV